MNGVDPGPFTLRELVWMATGRSKLAWDQTSTILWMLYSVNRGAKDPKLSPASFNPYQSKAKAAPVIDDVPLKTILKGMFGK